MAVDKDGNVYVTGWSETSWGSPLRAYSGSRDGYVAKLAPDGSLIWNTFIGGSASDYSEAIVVDASGVVYIAGKSDASWGSPVRSFTAGSVDGFVAKLQGNGSIVWNTFLGGSGLDDCRGIAVDGFGASYLTGISEGTWGSPIRAFVGPVEDAMVAKVASNGSLVWNTFIGGSGSDSGSSAAVDPGGETVVTGVSGSGWGSPIRAYSSTPDTFVARFDSTGNMEWNTFLGGTAADLGRSIALDSSSNAYVAGYSSYSWGSPLQVFAGDPDAFVSKVSETGTLIWHTFLGGSDWEDAIGISLDADGAPCIVGRSYGSWGPPANPYSGADDVFAAKVTSDGSFVWNTFLGGSSNDIGRAIAAGNDGAVYVGGLSANSWGAPMRSHAGGIFDGLVAKLLPCSSAPSISTEPADQTIANGNSATLIVSASGEGQLGYQWYIGASGDATNPIAGATASTYTTQPLFATIHFWVRVKNACGSVNSETATVTVTGGGTGPTITRIKSKKSKPGGAATILGTGFSATAANNKVYFGTKKAKITTAKTTTLKVTIPKKARKGSVSVQVEVGGNRSNSFVFLIK